MKKYEFENKKSILKTLWQSGTIRIPEQGTHQLFQKLKIQLKHIETWQREIHWKVIDKYEHKEKMSKLKALLWYFLKIEIPLHGTKKQGFYK